MKILKNIYTLFAVVLLSASCTQTFTFDLPAEKPTPAPDSDIPNDEIWYTSTDGNIVTPYASDVFGATIVSNTYADGKGVIKFSGAVTKIGKSAFYFRKTLNTITIPDSVEQIDDSAFSWSENIAEFNGKYATADKNCLVVDGKLCAFAPKGVSSYTIPDDVTYICANVFQNCDELTNVTIPTSVTEIESQSFFACDNLKSFKGKFASADGRCLVVDNTLKAFARAGLAEYAVPNGVKVIDGYVFYECTNLAKVTLPSGVLTIGDSAFMGCTNLKTINFPEGLLKIMGFAFSNCTSITEITIPISVTQIGSNVFEGCTKLATVYCNPTTPPQLGMSAFDDNAANRLIYVPFAALEEYKSMLYGWYDYADAIVARELTSAPYAVGDYYYDGVKEGVVFEIWDNGNSGKIVSMTKSSSTLQWSSDADEQKRLIGADSETDGAYNMTVVKVIADWESKYPAFKWCADLGEGWYLPAKEELLTIYNNKTAIDANLTEKIVTNYHWSSTEDDYYEDSLGEFCAWRVDMDNGRPNTAYKYIDYYVRATTTFGDTPKPEPTPDFEYTNIGDFAMVYVGGGTFTMGATSEQGSDADSDESPTHSVTLSDFYIGKYEVTQAQWRAVMGSNPSYFTGDNNPVEQVSWDDIQEFITKLNTQTGKNFRLPTEAEWEYAARGGNKSQGYKYSGSNTLSDVAWYTDNSSSTTHPVGEKQPNELGIYDMSGNVYEWCSDWYGSYSSDSQTNPTGPSSGSSRVLRGGGWFSYARGCRVSSRSGISPDCRHNGSGFRLACSPE